MVLFSLSSSGFGVSSSVWVVSVLLSSSPTSGLSSLLVDGSTTSGSSGSSSSLLFSSFPVLSSLFSGGISVLLVLSSRLSSVWLVTVLFSVGSLVSFCTTVSLVVKSSCVMLPSV